MKITKTLCLVEGEPPIPRAYDTIEFEDKKWIVPNWLVQPALGVKMPERLIQLDCLPHYEMDDRFLLEERLPKAVFSGHDQSQIKKPYVVLFRPDLALQIQQK